MFVKNKHTPDMSILEIFLCGYNVLIFHKFLDAITLTSFFENTHHTNIIENEELHQIMVPQP